MKKLGSGWTYDVYEYTQGRVLKKVRPFFRRVLRIIIMDPRLLFSFRKRITALDESSKRALLFVADLQNTDFDLSSLGNPTPVSEYEYTQDICIPVKHFLSDDQKMKEIIEKYIQQIHYFLQYGFADTVYNFTLNNGVTLKGDLVLLDFNEITYTIDDVLEAIHKEKWCKQHSYKFNLSRRQRAYFKKRMKEELTTEKVTMLWGKNK